MSDSTITTLVILVIFIFFSIVDGYDRRKKKQMKGFKTVHLWYGTTESGDCYIDLRKFIVYASEEKCSKEWLESPTFTAVAPVIQKNSEHQYVSFSARLCENSTLYFITKREYLRICKYGRLLGMVMPLPDYNKRREGKNKYELADESKFKLFGYNVGAKDDYSAMYRQKVLMFMIESGLTSKYEAINQLDFYISYHAHNYNNRLAISKWEADRLFLSNYTYENANINWVTTSNPPDVQALRTPIIDKKSPKESSDKTDKRNNTIRSINSNEKKLKENKHKNTISYEIDQIVNHRKYGMGIITDIDYDNNWVFIQFEKEDQARKFNMDILGQFICE